jgi:hypothetical protein
MQAGRHFLLAQEGLNAPHSVKTSGLWHSRVEATKTTPNTALTSLSIDWMIKRRPTS